MWQKHGQGGTAGKLESMSQDLKSEETPTWKSRTPPQKKKKPDTAQVTGINMPTSFKGGLKDVQYPQGIFNGPLSSFPIAILSSGRILRRRGDGSQCKSRQGKLVSLVGGMQRGIHEIQATFCNKYTVYICFMFFSHCYVLIW